MPHGGSEACEDECYRYYFLEVVAVHAVEGLEPREWYGCSVFVYCMLVAVRSVECNLKETHVSHAGRAQHHWGVPIFKGLYVQSCFERQHLSYGLSMLYIRVWTLECVMRSSDSASA